MAETKNVKRDSKGAQRIIIPDLYSGFEFI